ncbi:glycosyltransferase family 9 protein [Sphingomonas yabuuchiae]|uniref:glycosyltransferase family 9 protein n=1 Tax=Sphingomonas yabuuchiae TaxID=172044 RepID=UPI003D97E042
MMDNINARTIAVLRPAGLGDFIMTAPALLRLRERFPAARITLLTLHSQDVNQAEKVRAYAGGARAAPWIDLVRPHLIDDVRVLPPVRNLSTLREGRRIMSEIRPDLVVQMFDPGTPYVRRAMKLAFIAALCGPVRQIGWRQRGEIQAGRVPKQDPHLGHHVQGPLQFLRELEGRHTLSDADVRFDIRPGPEAEQWANEWLATSGLNEQRLIAMAPGAIHDHKQWPIEQFIRLVEALASAQSETKFLIMGTAKDRALAERLAEAVPGRVHDLCGVTSISQSAALFARCALVVGNDGGAMHLADAMGAPVVSVVPGLEFPVSIEPWHNQNRAVRHPVPCAPCYSFTFCPEGHRRCMFELPLAPVLAECERALFETAP